MAITYFHYCCLLLLLSLSKSIRFGWRTGPWFCFAFWGSGKWVLCCCCWWWSVELKIGVKVLLLLLFGFVGFVGFVVVVGWIWWDVYCKKRRTQSHELTEHMEWWDAAGVEEEEEGKRKFKFWGFCSLCIWSAVFASCTWWQRGCLKLSTLFLEVSIHEESLLATSETFFHHSRFQKSWGDFRWGEARV